MTTTRTTWLLGLLTMSVVGCHQPAPPAPATPKPVAAPPKESPKAAPLSNALPESIDSFKGGKLIVDPAFVRRDYQKGKVRIDVTVAKYLTTADQYQQWVQMSASYPAAKLDIPPGSGSGFYDCSGTGAAAFCNVHIQLRPWYHIEIMGDGTATRADLDDLLRGLPLRSLVPEK